MAPRSFEVKVSEVPERGPADARPVHNKALGFRVDAANVDAALAAVKERFGAALRSASAAPGDKIVAVVHKGKGARR